MGAIRIFANGIELEFAKETLSIRKDNNAFTGDFRVSHSSFPFLLVEGNATRAALGTRELASVKKKKVFTVTVVESGNTYFGELTVLNYMTGFRKCDLKYGSEIIRIMDKKLSALLPVVSVIPGETTPVPFTQEAFEPVDGYEEWQEYPLGFQSKIYPEAMFQFPMMSWPDKYWEERPAEGDEWYYYLGQVNRYHPDPIFFEANNYNIYGEFGQEISIFNRNVPSPQLFLLGILNLAFASIGYSIKGPFVESAFARRVLVLSTKDNLCKVNITPELQYINFSDLENQGNLLFYTRYNYDFVPDAAGEYTFNYFVIEPLRSGGITMQNHKSLLVYTQDGQETLVYKNTNDPEQLTFQGSFTISISDDQVGDTVKIQWRRLSTATGNPVQFLINWNSETKVFNMMHPTIQLGRYAPDWTLADFVNEVKKLFCLKVTTDDLAKTVDLSFTGDMLLSAGKFVSPKSLALSDYSPADYVAYIFKYANDTDTFIYATPEGVELNRDSDSAFVSTIDSKFKLVDHNGTANLSTAEDKDGVGLMLFDPPESEDFVLPLTASDYQGHHLGWNGPGGIYQTYWKNVTQFLLTASTLEINGPFTETEIAQLDRLQKIYADNQEYVITSMEYRRTQQDNYQVKFVVKSVNL